VAPRGARLAFLGRDERADARRGPSIAASAVDEEHEHCTTVARHRERLGVRVLSAFVVASASARPDESPGGRAPSPDSIALYRLAPKQSPPRG
jgi:hypothetical protein